MANSGQVKTSKTGNTMQTLRNEYARTRSVEFQHPKVKTLAIVIDHEGKVFLRSSAKRESCSDWFLYGFDHQREFVDVKSAVEVALKVCPIYNSGRAKVAQFRRYRIDSHGQWYGI